MSAMPQRMSLQGLYKREEEPVGGGAWQEREEPGGAGGTESATALTGKCNGKSFMHPKQVGFDKYDQI